MRKEQFEEDQFYHIYSRGVDKRFVFLDEQDRFRFINTLYTLNNFLNIPYRFNLFTLEPRDLLTRIDPYVEIGAGCLMLSHYHPFTYSKEEGGRQ